MRNPYIGNMFRKPEMALAPTAKPRRCQTHLVRSQPRLRQPHTARYSIDEISKGPDPGRVPCRACPPITALRHSGVLSRPDRANRKPALTLFAEIVHSIQQGLPT